MINFLPNKSYTLKKKKKKKKKKKIPLTRTQKGIRQERKEKGQKSVRCAERKTRRRKKAAITKNAWGHLSWTHLWSMDCGSHVVDPIFYYWMVLNTPMSFNIVHIEVGLRIFTSCSMLFFMFFSFFFPPFFFVPQFPTSNTCMPKSSCKYVSEG